jgi:hypothetical protein
VEVTSLPPQRTGTPGPAAWIQRACACGAAAGISSECPDCAAEKRLGLQAKLGINPPDDRWEREADRIADKVVSEHSRAPEQPLSVTPLVQRQAVEEAKDDEEEGMAQAKAAASYSTATSPLPAAAAAVAAGGQPLSRSERTFFEPRFGRDLSLVRLHNDTRAACAASSINARAYTLRNHIAFAAGQYCPHAAEGRHLMAHEITHTLQQRTNAPRTVLQRQPTSLGAIPETERQAIQIQTTDVEVPAERITAFFTLMSSGRPSESFSIGAINSFGTGIDPSLHTGLGSVGAWLAGQTNVLPVDFSVEVALDLSAHGGANRRYRFTRFNHTTGSGGSANTTEVMLIEDVGAETALAQQTVATSVTIGANNYPVSGTWTPSEFTLLHHALNELPPAAQTAANGLTFQRDSGNSPGGEPGHYDETADEVHLFDNAFNDASVRFGGETMSVRNIVHEIGHSLDLRPLEAEWQRFNTAGQTGAARRRLLRQRSLSGSRHELDTTGTWQREIIRGDRAPDFRVAVRRDGVRNDNSGGTTPEGTTATLSGGPTTYSDTDYEELFAESFMLYVNDPDRLQTLRPQTFAYFQRRYPRPTP